MKIARDKVLHIAAGFVIAVLVGALISPAAGFLMGLLAGLAKEGYDLWANKRAARRHLVEPHTVESADVYATAGGAALGAVLVFLVRGLL